MNKQGKIILISGPSGVGKKTIIDLLKTNENLNLSYSISYTTREKRKTEINGKDYFFISVEEFKQKIKNGDFLEYAVFCNNYYGTDKNQVISMINNGFNVILEIEVQGAKNVLNIIPKNSIISIFILPPNIEELVKHVNILMKHELKHAIVYLNISLKKLYNTHVMLHFFHLLIHFYLRLFFVSLILNV